MTRYLDDFEVGEVFVADPVVLDEEEIISFAERYDPQPFHTDPKAAKDSYYKGLIASGFQTTVVAFSQFARLGLIVESSMGGPGLDDVRWLVPVRPGDRLHTQIEVLEVRPSKSKPDRGVIRFAFRVDNQAGETVCTFSSVGILKRHPSRAAGGG